MDQFIVWHRASRPPRSGKLVQRQPLQFVAVSSGNHRQGNLGLPLGFPLSLNKKRVPARESEGGSEGRGGVGRRAGLPPSSQIHPHRGRPWKVLPPAPGALKQPGAESSPLNITPTRKLIFSNCPQTWNRDVENRQKGQTRGNADKSRSCIVWRLLDHLSAEVFVRLDSVPCATRACFPRQGMGVLPVWAELSISPRQHGQVFRRKFRGKLGEALMRLPNGPDGNWHP